MAGYLKKTIEKTVEGTLFLSSTITTLTVLLIIVFLFREGWGLIGSSPVEKGEALLINKSNKVEKLTGEQIKRVFDQEITNWKELGGSDLEITLVRIDDIGNYYTEEQLGPNFEHLGEKVTELVEATPGIIAFIPDKYADKTGRVTHLNPKKISLFSFVGGTEWYPTGHPAARFGILSLIMGTLWVSLAAIIIALPLGLATAIYMAEIANEKVRRALKPVIELLSGIPSVVYGFFGLVVIVPAIQKIFALSVGETALSGAIILAIMALPTIITISEDAIRTAPRAMKEASLALGANKWQTIYKVILPYASSGITAAIILGIGRAIGETMAVLMVTGNSAVMPHSLLQPVRTIPATIAAELGEAPQGGLHYKALFALGAVLFIIVLVLNLTVEFGLKKKRR
ncbi:MAG TPA: phosphate ABC transporter permease subunit PstC [Bacteroidales bacterium]|nr:phosphate ABC transporter permease subunit PstC [Bacteroidales bacterium]